MIKKIYYQYGRSLYCILSSELKFSILITLIDYLPLPALCADEDETEVFVFVSRVHNGIGRKEADVIIGQKDDDVVGIVPFKIAAVICKIFVTRVGKAQKHHIGLSLKPFENDFHCACDVVLIINLGGEIFDIDEIERSAGGEGENQSA